MSAVPINNSVGDEVERLIEALRPFVPISTHDTPDYAELRFGEHQTQAMTMQPNDWQQLQAAFERVEALSTTPNIDGELASLRAMAKEHIAERASWSRLCHRERERAKTAEANIDEVIMAAYEAGAQAVHDNYQEDRDPCFREAARDYVSSLQAVKP